MQALWSRTAQTRSCQCGPCLHATAAVRAVSRRTTSNINRRRIKAGDIFAGSFTAMFATAAVLDMRKKEERTREWDRAIEEVRSGKEWDKITTPDSISIGKHAEKESNIMGKEIHEYAPDANIVKAMKGLSVGKLVGATPMSMAEAQEKSAQGRKGIHSVRDELDRILAELTKTSDENAIAISEAEDTQVAQVEEVDNSIFAERGPDGMQDTNFRELKMETWQPTDQFSASQIGEKVGQLVYELLSTVVTKSKTETEVDNNNEAPQAIRKRRLQKAEIKARAIYQDMRELSSSGGSYPQYKVAKPENETSEREALNESIAHLMSDGLRRDDRRSLDQMLAGVCYNLLASSASPDITTFNIMIERFTRYKQHDHANLVIKFLEASPFKANERTISAILNHYRATNYDIGFRRTINRIRGFEGGLGLREIKTGKLVKSKFAARWAANNDFVFKKGVLREPAKINGQLYETLIRGCMQFGRVGQALGYLRTAIQRGEVIRKKLFHEVVKYCVSSDRPQYYLIMLLGALVKQFKDGVQRAQGIQYDFFVRETIHMILQAVGLEPTVESLRQLQQSTRMPCDIHPPNFAALLEHMENEEVKDEFISLFRHSTLVGNKIANVKMAINRYKRVQLLIEDIPTTKKLTDRAEAHAAAKFYLGNKDWTRNLGLPREEADALLRIVNRLGHDEFFSLTDARLQQLGITSEGVRERLLERIQLLQSGTLPNLRPLSTKDQLEAVKKLNTYAKALFNVRRNAVRNVYRDFPKDVRLRYTNIAKNISQKDAIMVLLETRRILSLEGRLINAKSEKATISQAEAVEQTAEKTTTEDMVEAVVGTKPEFTVHGEEEVVKEYTVPNFTQPGFFDPTPEIRWAPLELTPNGYVRRPIPNADIRVQM